MKCPANPVTNISGKTVTIRDDEESGTDEGVHESTRQMTYINGPITELVSTLMATHGDGDSLDLFAATSGYSVEQRRVSVTGYIN